MKKKDWMFKLKSLGILLFVNFTLIGYSSSMASEGVSMASGFGVAHIVPFRMGFQKEFHKNWRPDSEWPIGGYWEGSFYKMNGQRGIKPSSHARLDAVALAGAFRFQRKARMKFGWPYVEIGLGLSWLSKKEIGGRDLGIHFQFEDRLGLGFRFGEHQQYDISYRAIHFSNAYIGPSNHGINLHIIVLGYWFN